MSQALPETDRLTDDQQYASRTWMQWLSWVHRVVSATTQHGTTADRPTTLLWIGRRYFDDTLGLPVYVKSVRPVVWVNGAGAPV